MTSHKKVPGLSAPSSNRLKEDHRLELIKAAKATPDFEKLHEDVSQILDIPSSMVGLWQIVSNLPEILTAAHQWANKKDVGLGTSLDLIQKWLNAVSQIPLDSALRQVPIMGNGPEFIAKELRSWLSGIGVKTAYIEPGSPWENGFCESFNGTFRDNLLDGEIFYSLKEAQIIVGEWVKHYNHVRPHSALGYRPPAPQTQVPQIIQNQPMLLQ